jgi:hypothetical protein
LFLTSLLMEILRRKAGSAGGAVIEFNTKTSCVSARFIQRFLGTVLQDTTQATSLGASVGTLRA